MIYVLLCKISIVITILFHWLLPSGEISWLQRYDTIIPIQIIKADQ